MVSLKLRDEDNPTAPQTAFFHSTVAFLDTLPLAYQIVNERGNTKYANKNAVFLHNAQMSFVRKHFVGMKRQLFLLAVHPWEVHRP